MCLWTAPALAQQAPARGQLEGAGVLDPDGPIPESVISQYYKQCRSYYPPRFMPDSLEYYCTCTSVAMRDTMTGAEYENLQKRNAKKVGNPVFEKYISKIVAPCLDKPTEDLEYFSCVLDRDADERLSSIPRYCKCVSSKMRSHVNRFGDADMMISLSQSNSANDPFEALWSSTDYMRAKITSREQCLYNYMNILTPPSRNRLN